jgi:uncharacterized membrane protein YkvA (DUF1232 family)
MATRRSSRGRGPLRLEVLPPVEDRRFYARLRKDVEAWAARHVGSAASQVLLAAPDLFVLLARLARDPRVSRLDKAKLGAVLVYFVSPVDLVPEALLGPFGYVDDVALAALVLNHFVNRLDASLIEEHWPGRERVRVVLQRTLGLANTVLGGPLWARIRRMMNG